mmetsp:Transcript_10169/g.13267  ORF Transcript_10169/g.13267 Transcript_10169/m.13267 type:complete len:534 (+) Transcript_10169:47-1648(+)
MALCYFKNQYSKEPKGWIYLEDVSEIIEDSNSISIISPSRRMKLRAQTRAEHRLWLQGLTQACPEAHAELQDANLLGSLRGDSAGGPRNHAQRQQRAPADGKEQDLDEERYNGPRDAYEEEAWNQNRRGRGDTRDPPTEFYRGTSYDADETDRWHNRDQRNSDGDQNYSNDYYYTPEQEADMGGGGSRRIRRGGSRGGNREDFEEWDESLQAGGRGSRQTTYENEENWRGDDPGGYEEDRESFQFSEQGTPSRDRQQQRSPQNRKSLSGSRSPNYRCGEIEEDLEEDCLPTSMKGSRPSNSPPRGARDAFDRVPEPDPAALEETKDENPHLEESKCSEEAMSPSTRRKSVRKAKDVISPGNRLDSMTSIDDRLKPEIGKFELEDSSDSDAELDLEAEKKRLSENQARHHRNSLKASAEVENVVLDESKEAKPVRRKPPGPPPGKREKHKPAVVADKDFATEDWDDDNGPASRRSKGKSKSPTPELTAQAKKEMDEDWDVDMPQQSKGTGKTNKKKSTAAVKEDNDWLEDDFDT